jgi:hypothetical protein
MIRLYRVYGAKPYAALHLESLYGPRQLSPWKCCKAEFKVKLRPENGQQECGRASTLSTLLVRFDGSSKRASLSSSQQGFLSPPWKWAAGVREGIHTLRLLMAAVSERKCV